MLGRAFGPTGVDVSVIGQGTWQLRDPDQAERTLRLGLDLGLTHIDTAQVYEGSEEVVGRAIRGRRREVFLVTKVRPPNTTYDRALESAYGSRERLGVDQVDVLLQHWWDSRRGCEETMRAFARLLDEKKIRYAGVSNFTVEQMEVAQSVLGRHKIACNQIYYSPEQRGMEHEILPYCRQHGIAIVAYSPFGSGRPPRPGSRGWKALVEIGKRCGLSPFQVILNWVTRDLNVFVIPKAEREEHVRDNAAALDVALSSEDLSLLEEAFPLASSKELPII